MLMVLGTTVILLTTAAIIASARATDSIAARSNADLLDAITIAEATDDPILLWLDLEAEECVIHPDQPDPMVLVLADTVVIEGRQARISVAAWDQFAMSPKSEQIDEYRSISGLDELDAPGSVFPSPLHPDRLGAKIATHNPIPGQQTRGNAAPSINLNTTPASRLRQLFSRYNISGLEEVLASRLGGEPARGSTIRINNATPYQLVSSSRCWSIRTDVRFGLASLSLWSVYVQRGGAWMLEQRIVIPD
jgi:hypothetical protein